MIRSWLRAAARFLERLGEPPPPVRLTDRNQLLRLSARTEGDSCEAFVVGAPGDGKCETDGHYLCVFCSQMTHYVAVDRELVECTDENCLIHEGEKS